MKGRYQPRQNFDATALQELADSIAEQGIIEPIIVRRIAQDRFEIVAGERRWRAAQMAGLFQVPCLVRDYSDEQAAEVTLIENIQRENLNPIEEGQALARLIGEFHYTHEQLAMALGKSRAKITNTLRLLLLDPRVKTMIIEKQLTEGHGKVLAGFPLEQQYVLAQQCYTNDWSVRRIEQEVKSQKHNTSCDSEFKDPNLTRLERVTSERFNAEVKLDNSQAQKSGWLKIKYYDFETLSGILEKMGVELE